MPKEKKAKIEIWNHDQNGIMFLVDQHWLGTFPTAEQARAAIPDYLASVDPGNNFYEAMPTIRAFMEKHGGTLSRACQDLERGMRKKRERLGLPV